MPEARKVEHHKRAGIFYGSPEGHPIIWNNDWNSLIQKEVLARDTFSRKFLAGEVAMEHASFANPVRGESREWKSTYADLGEWGPKTFRKNVPHKVSKTDVELPSIPPSRAGSRAMSEYAYRHANFQLGKTIQEPYEPGKTTQKPPKIMAAIQQVKRSQANEAKEAGGGSQTRRGQAGGGGQRPASQNAMVGGPSSQEERVALKQFLAATLLSTVKGKQARQEVKQALSRSLAKEESAGAQQEATSVNPFEGGGRQRRTGTAASGEMLSDSAKWKSVYEDLGSWGPKTQQRARPKIITKIDVEGFGGNKDINRPVYPGSPKPHTGAKHWVTDYSGFGHWGPDTFRKWIPPKVNKSDVEKDPNVSDVKLKLATPKVHIKDAIKTSSLEGPRPVWEPTI